jgi:hypothetical protein
MVSPFSNRTDPCVAELTSLALQGAGEADLSTYPAIGHADEIPTSLQLANADTEVVSNPTANHQEIHVNEALDFSLPPTSGRYLAEPPTTPSAAAPVSATAPPDVDELTALREKVAELDHVISLAKIRVETLGAEKREALERALRLEAQLEAAQRREAELLDRIASLESPRRFDDQTVADLLNRVAALEAIVAPSRAA